MPQEVERDLVVSPTGKAPIATRLGLAIRRQGRRQGLRQEALAEAAGLHRTYVGYVERGERNITMASLERLADALGTPVSSLVLAAESPPRRGGLPPGEAPVLYGPRSTR